MRQERRPTASPKHGSQDAGSAGRGGALESVNGASKSARNTGFPSGPHCTDITSARGRERGNQLRCTLLINHTPIFIKRSINMFRWLRGPWETWKPTWLCGSFPGISSMQPHLFPFYRLPYTITRRNRKAVRPATRIVNHRVDFTTFVQCRLACWVFSLKKKSKSEISDDPKVTCIHSKPKLGGIICKTYLALETKADGSNTCKFYIYYNKNDMLICAFCFNITLGM